MLDTVIAAAFHAWERKLAAVTTDRIVRPFEWGLEWIASNGHGPEHAPDDVMSDWVARVMADTPAFFTPDATDGYRVERTSDDEALLTFPSALTTPHQA